MISKKLLLSITAISLIYSGCNDNEKTPKTNTQVEKTVPSKTDNAEPIVKKAEAITPTVKKLETITSIPTVQSLYKKCSSCHGLNAEKKALNKSAVIKDWNASQIEEALKGYKAGTYGGAMKGVMQAQASALSDQEIEALAQHIADFK
ncbi:MAG: c-type cytochrome [Arcobacteraceae bacterium]